MPIANDTTGAPTFEFGLSLAGGVSCGAFTAGALDFIVEALDAWEDAKKQQHRNAPPHDVVLSIVAGASSGALTAAVLGALLPYRINPVRMGATAETQTGNPLFDSWVNGTGLKDLLRKQDAGAAEGVRSVFDPTQVDVVARNAINFGIGAMPRSRNWLADPLRFGFTVTNLRGAKLSLDRPHSMLADPTTTMHGDVMRFAIGGIGARQAPPPRGDEEAITLRRNAPDAWDVWGKTFATAALASAAFPVVLPARRLRPPAGQYTGKTTVLQGGACGPDVVARMPPVGAAAQSGYQFDGVDGGLIDNNGIDVARMELLDRDPLACNPRDGLLSQRAVLMIDPMLGARSKIDDLPRPPISFAGTLSGLLKTLLDQARLRPEQMALAMDDGVYSRFIIVPHRETEASDEPSADLAGAALGGLGGYLCREFREHDYLLGRCNAQQALATHFVLPGNNPLFDGWTDDQCRLYAVEGTGELPIIPLFGRLHPGSDPNNAEPLPPWPQGKADALSFAPDIDSRLKVLYCNLLRPWWLRVLFYPLWVVARRPIRKWLVAAMAKGLHAHGL